MKKFVTALASLLVILCNGIVLAACGNQTVIVESVKLDKTELTLEAGSVGKLTATVEPAHAADLSVNWTTGDEAVAVVDDGNVRAIAAGSATVTATAGGKSAVCAVTVTAPAVPMSQEELTEALRAAVNANNFTASFYTVPDVGHQTVKFDGVNRIIEDVGNGYYDGNSGFEEMYQMYKSQVFYTFELLLDETTEFTMTYESKEDTYIFHVTVDGTATDYSIQFAEGKVCRMEVGYGEYTMVFTYYDYGITHPQDSSK